MGKLTDQFFVNPDNYKDKHRQRMYLKDIDCPQVWEDKLKDLLPPSIFYWNDSTGDIGGPGATLDPNPGARRARGIAIAGDLMSSLPQEMRAANLMCYIGHEGTYTPSHREMCATMSHNIMVNTSSNVDEDGNAEKPGSSLWFMTETKDRNVVAEFWRATLGHDIELEDHFAQIAAWQRAPFTTYVVEQRVGDFVLIPPLAPHQVWNRGTRTVKIAWNRTTVETLELALHEALHSSRMVCREEQYKCKAMIYYTLLKYSNLITQGTELARRSTEQWRALTESKKFRQLQKDFRRLFELFKEIMLSEMLKPETREVIEYMPTDTTDNLSCSYCRCNIFNRFLTCKSCNMIEGKEEPYDVCMDCYAMGRSCACRSGLKWVEQFKWRHLLEKYNYWRQQIIQLAGGQTGRTPETLDEERKLYSKRTLAEICQQQLKQRPFVDIKKQEEVNENDESESDEEVRLNEDGTVKKVVKKRSQAYLNKHKSCHSCIHRHPTWKMANCTNCERWWCYGSLFRGYDLHPIGIMEDPHWECPHCLKICSTGACRKDYRQKPHVPAITHLGHDTRKVADFRSIEALVDFAQSNLNFIRQEGEQIHRLQIEAEKSRQHDDAASGDDVDPDADVGDEGARPRIAYSPSEMIDPALGGAEAAGNGPAGQNVQSLAPMAATTWPEEMDTSIYPELDGQNGDRFVAPGAVLYQPSDIDPNYNNVDAADEPNSKKRRQTGDIEPIKIVQRPAKRRKAGAVVEDENASQTKASKQFQHESNKKQLDKARKEGRYLRVWSKMNNKSLRVTLNVPSEYLYQLQANDEVKRKAREHAQVQANVLLRSDIVQPPVRQREVVSQVVEQPKAKHTLFRARIEEDGDFNARSRSSKSKHKPRPKFEEITVLDDSDEEFIKEIEAEQAQRAQPRKSDWLAKKREGEDDELPEELPDDWKDSTAGRKNRRQTVPSFTSRSNISQPTPRFRPIEAGNEIDLTNQPSSDESEDDEEEEAAESNSMDAAAIAKAAMEQDANLQAKMHAMDWTNGEEEDNGTRDEASPEKSTTTAASQSLQERMRGKKIKIVSIAASKPRFRGNGGPPGRSSLPGGM